MAKFILLVSIACLFAVSHAVDETRQPNSYGADVVEAVVNLIRKTCLFADDKRFLRRLAYVESSDGLAPRTYRAGYDGGIWQVDLPEFNVTQNEPQLAREYQIIQDKFGINWNTVQWSDLRKPLYSGIAAALYTLTELRGSPLSWKTEEQGNFWGGNFHHGHGSASNFTELAKLLDLGCRVSHELDIVFVLDTSSSLDMNDFHRALDFIKSVIDEFPISPVQTQVGMVTYSSLAHVEFHLNTYGSKTDVQNAVDNIPYRAGGTATDKGLETALLNVFDTNGGRPNAVKVMVVITDGKSNDKYDTHDAAELVHQSGIVTFAVGVGSQIEKTEINTIATDPDCTHAYEVNSFSEIKFMKEEIQKATCTAPLFINTTYSCELGKCPTFAVITNPTNGTTIETNITCGGMNVYSAISNPYPNGASYEYFQQTLANELSRVFYNISGQTLYINFKDNQNTGGGANSSYCIATITVVPGKHVDQTKTVKCYLGPKEMNCDESYFNCTDAEKWNFPNPCTDANILADKLKFPHPYSSNKFLMCDLSGKMYIVYCPPGETFYADCSQCIGENSKVVAGCVHKFVSTNVTNPCTRETILAGKLFFAYPLDPHKFIHCDIWGKPWVQSCQAGMEWDEGLLTCFKPSTYDPCRHHAAGQPYLYPHPCDPHRYIHCDTSHESFDQSCQLDYVFFVTSQVCVPPGSYPGTANLINTCNGAQVQHNFTHPTVTAGPIDPLASYLFSNQPYTAPCTYANIQANNLYFRYKYNNHNFIQCDLYGHQYLKDCDPNYFDPYTSTCVDGSVFVDPLVG